jgi:predicted restriction endonuclease
MALQNYEEYWKLTNAFTDYNGRKFLTTLRICVEFIYEFSTEPYSNAKYTRLQGRLIDSLGITDISVRKAINQLVKMGFINSFLATNHPLSIEYLNARTNSKRNTLLSKIVYSNSGFNKAVNNESNIKQINFLIQTLIEKGTLTKPEIIALMLVDIEDYPEEFITVDKLQDYVAESERIGFFGRKYNQIHYLTDLLGKLDNLIFVNEELYFRDDAIQIFGEDLEPVVLKRRDPYLHRLYKNQLQEECQELYGASKCMLERLSYPVLIASHIKPFILSDENEAYDPNNGLLLSRTIDSLFDLKYISFTNEGEIIFSNRTPDDVKDFWSNYTLDGEVLNEQRMNYLAFHRNLMKELDARFA